MTSKPKKAKVTVDDESTSDIQYSSNSEAEEIKTPSESSHSDTEEEIDEESRNLLNEGWADSIAKILKTNKPKKKKTLVLSKAKKLNDPVKKVTTEHYEIATIDGQVRKEQTIVEEKKANSENRPKRKKRDLPTLRVKPNILEKDRDRTLQKIATKGVVQLFNAVRTQQKDINQKLHEAGPLEVRKEKVLKNIDKRAFLDLLMGEKSSVVDNEVPKNKDESKTYAKKAEEPSWNVLRDDFLLSAKIKDWDKELEQESDKEVDVEIESD
ncbi:RRP15-like protein [Euwallacea similis]|uniref:RRP15-like protein n=1 Tax=Euwallacea similis TaxID=1736056 RepID=UPI00344F8A62